MTDTDRGDQPNPAGTDQSGDGPAVRFSTRVFQNVENVVYVALGFLLSVTALLGLASTLAPLWEAIHDWTGATAIFDVIERLLFVFMLIEILHTVRASLQSHTLSCEPFLIVGLIASIRRVLVITLQTSEVFSDKAWTPEHDMLFRATMIELGVLAVLILVMVLSIRVLRANAVSGAPTTLTGRLFAGL